MWDFEVWAEACPDLDLERLRDNSGYALSDTQYAWQIWRDAWACGMCCGLEEYEAQIAALKAKVGALSAHGACGCSYDKPDDLCMHHSPQLVSKSAEIGCLIGLLGVAVGASEIDDPSICLIAEKRIALRKKAMDEFNGRKQEGGG